MPDDPWDRIEPLLPARQQRLRRVARPERLPQELDSGSGTTCRRRLRDRPEAGARDRLCHVLLTGLHRAGEPDRSRAVIDGPHRQARRGGPEQDRARSAAPARARTAR
ncbi:hypothetical protein [Kitasatospora sp. NPDC057500]|uniref:hypothetical protein n=1 Tax=Kitasatospora sp. NPDC057500 TaxID=3346151 RepID=UPI00369784EC